MAPMSLSCLLVLTLASAFCLGAVELPSKKYLNLAAVKTMVAAAEAEAQKRGVSVTLCLVDEGGNLLFLQRGEGAGINTVEFATRKARHAAFYGRPSKSAADQAKTDPSVLAFPNAFPNQGGVPVKIDGKTLGGFSASGAPSEVDEAIAQAGVDALLK